MNRYLLLTAVLLPWVSQAQEWTRFRGPNGSGLSDAKTIPTRWTPDDVNWKVRLPGTGHSSPVVWGDQVFVTVHDADDGMFRILSVGVPDGKIRWQRDYPFAELGKHDLNSFASGSPAVDSERVYASRTETDRITLTAHSHAGDPVWETDLGPYVGTHGGGISPIVHEDLVLIANEQRGTSFLTAIDAATGATRWRLPRQSDAGNYSTPCVLTAPDGEPLMIVNSELHGISAFRPADGSAAWTYEDAFDKRSVSSPIIAGDLVIGSCGSGGGGNYVVAVRPGTANRPAELAYEIRRSAPYVPTSICVADTLYLWSDGGIVSRVDAATGEVHWQERVGGRFFSSPVCVDDRLFCISTTGEVVVLAVGEAFKVLARNPLNELVHSTPAIAGGRMYVHSNEHLISIGGR